MDPVLAKAIADLPFPAFLILLGSVFFWLTYKGILRWNREVARAEKEASDWKAIAETATTTAAQQSEQISKLTSIVETIAKHGGVV